jgi:hypothetical protein
MGTRFHLDMGGNCVLVDCDGINAASPPALVDAIPRLGRIVLEQGLVAGIEDDDAVARFLASTAMTGEGDRVEFVVPVDDEVVRLDASHAELNLSGMDGNAIRRTSAIVLAALTRFLLRAPASTVAFGGRLSGAPLVQGLLDRFGVSTDNISPYAATLGAAYLAGLGTGADARPALVDFERLRKRGLQ